MAPERSSPGLAAGRPGWPAACPAECGFGGRTASSTVLPEPLLPQRNPRRSPPRSPVCLFWTSQVDLFTVAFSPTAAPWRACQGPPCCDPAVPFPSYCPVSPGAERPPFVPLGPWGCSCLPAVRVVLPGTLVPKFPCGQRASIWGGPRVGLQGLGNSRSDLLMNCQAAFRWVLRPAFPEHSTPAFLPRPSVV